MTVILQTASADVNKDGNTLLHTVALLGYTERVRLLLAVPGIDVNKADEDGWTPLDIALKNGHTECARLIKAAGGTKRSFWRKLFG